MRVVTAVVFEMHRVFSRELRHLQLIETTPVLVEFHIDGCHLYYRFNTISILPDLLHQLLKLV